MAIKHRIERLEQKRDGRIRVVHQKDVEQALVNTPLSKGEILIVLDDNAAGL